ncbi:uncharacterized protein LOC142984175 [Anticarsia gemmatalis]|uniref:uncharacterized protein LOC142984175 n=1 Tax=Anticarsia gemmatalis TaxID=129554 RepID=UPI003F7740C0
MYLILLWIFLLKPAPSILKTLLPQHMDFQKVGEVIFNNEKYKILKPTTHIVADYFEDYILKQDNDNFPSKRRFIDDNGLRHYWTGFEKKSKSLRKTELISDVVETIDNENISESPRNDERNPSTKNAQTKDSIEKIPEDNSAKTSANDKDDEQATENSEEILSTSVGTTVRETPRRKKRPTLATNEPEVKMHISEKPILKQGGRTLVKTTFFCPFFGIVTMSAFVD